MVIKYIDQGNLKLSFLQDIQLYNVTADAIYSSVNNFHVKNEIAFAKMIAFTSDGPSVMLCAKMVW